jgi:hypothetical protein
LNTLPVLLDVVVHIAGIEYGDGSLGAPS